MRMASDLPPVFSTRIRLLPGSTSDHLEVLPASWRMPEKANPCPEPLICRSPMSMTTRVLSEQSPGGT